MTIHRDGWDGPITFQCDGCGTTFEPQGLNFYKAVIELKAANWKTTQIGRKWLHTCSKNCFVKARRMALA